jgi:GH25 family lysozyme M1 (1,4-beta-N-acetylmuramidase)
MFGLGSGKKHSSGRNGHNDRERRYQRSGDRYDDERFDDTRDMDQDDERFDDTRDMDQDDDRFDDTRDMDQDDDRFDDTRDMDQDDDDTRYDDSEYEDDDPDGRYAREDAEYDNDNYDSFSEDDGDEDYYGDDERHDDRYDDEDYYGDEDDSRGRRQKVSGRKRSRRRKQSPVAAFFSEIGYRFGNMSHMDRTVAATGAFVLAVAIVTVSIYASAKGTQKQVSEFQSIGQDMSGVSVIGQSGLIAVSDAENARLAAMTTEESTTEESTEESSSEDAEVTVTLKLTSIKADLKLKFINKETGKLIAGVPFKATATGPASIDLVDDDEDGIIYKKNVAAGDYTVKVKALSDDLASKYKFASDTAKCTVSEKIEYKKVDIKDEVKTEKQVNAAKEDTKVTNDTPVESKLTDTVDWVESSKTGADGSSADGYIEVDKNSVPDPSASSMAVFFKADAVSSSSESAQGITNTSNTSSGAAVVPAGGVAVVPAGGESLSTSTTTSTTESKAAESKAASSTGTSTNTSSSTTTSTSTSKTGQKITLSASTVKLIKGKTIAITPTVTGASDTTVTWTVSDVKVASLSASSTKDNAAVTVTALASGTATITAALKENTAVTAACALTVTNVDMTAKLTDKDGHQLYVLVNGKYVAATYADYAKYDKFYRKSDNSNWIYTGWQTIDGSTYFYTKDHNYVTGEQVIQGVKYTFGSDGRLQAGSGTLGIDVSKWNGSIDWTQVRNSGVSYAIIRCGYRGKATGALVQDPRFAANVRGARAAGLSVGLYFFSQATSDVEAVEEASMAASLASGCGVSLPIYIDVEGSGGRGDGIDSGTRTAVCKAFCATVQNSGYTAGVYSNKSWLTSRLDIGSLSGYKIWLAQYAAHPSYSASRYDMWQYTSSGNVGGISGRVDMDLRFN